MLRDLRGENILAKIAIICGLVVRRALKRVSRGEGIALHSKADSVTILAWARDLFCCLLSWRRALRGALRTPPASALVGTLSAARDTSSGARPIRQSAS